MEIKTGKPFRMLPPAPDLCQICATKHDPTQPHNAQSFYFQYWFFDTNGRKATWADAMLHCDEKTKAPWLAGFEACGIDINSENLTGEIMTLSDLEQRLKKQLSN